MNIKTVNSAVLVKPILTTLRDRIIEKMCSEGGIKKLKYIKQTSHTNTAFYRDEVFLLDQEEHESTERSRTHCSCV